MFGASEFGVSKIESFKVGTCETFWELGAQVDDSVLVPLMTFSLVVSLSSRGTPRDLTSLANETRPFGVPQGDNRAFLNRDNHSPAASSDLPPVSTRIDRGLAEGCSRPAERN